MFNLYIFIDIVSFEIKQNKTTANLIEIASLFKKICKYNSFFGSRWLHIITIKKIYCLLRIFWDVKIFHAKKSKKEENFAINFFYFKIMSRYVSLVWSNTLYIFVQKRWLWTHISRLLLVYFLTCQKFFLSLFLNQTKWCA